MPFSNTRTFTIYKQNIHSVNKTNNKRPNGNSNERQERGKNTHSPSLKVDNNKKRFVGTIALPWLLQTHSQTENQWFWMYLVFNVSNLFVFSFLSMIFVCYKTTIWCVFGLSTVFWPCMSSIRMLSIRFIANEAFADTFFLTFFLPNYYRFVWMLCCSMQNVMPFSESERESEAVASKTTPHFETHLWN